MRIGWRRCILRHRATCRDENGKRHRQEHQEARQTGLLSVCQDKVSGCGCCGGWPAWPSVIRAGIEAQDPVDGPSFFAGGIVFSPALLAAGCIFGGGRVSLAAAFWVSENFLNDMMSIPFY
jgi:hypothetical protein